MYNRAVKSLKHGLVLPFITKVSKLTFNGRLDKSLSRTDLFFLERSDREILSFFPKDSSDKALPNGLDRNRK